ncbi:hypothetical protein L2U69_11830 [Zavarzinia compransoris]|uniref:hypothetical protein n=1 Tax=Zavarzinia marina TaxID=2911065 RepID=UPI001F273A53|nr:hypothetical protein [Zavarzinia marina]MCF4166336.1 hypothetical protein [Zavarzinia marina]
MADETYIPGDHWVICDRTGFKVRASETRKEWNGLRVWNKVWEPRHPQDFVRGRADDQAVRDARPRQEDVFLSPGDVTPENL